MSLLVLPFCIRSRTTELWAVELPSRALHQKESTLGDSGKYEVDVGSIFGRYLIKCDLFAFSIVESPLLGDGPGLLHVDLVPNDHRDDIRFVVLLCVNISVLMSFSSESKLSKVLSLVTS
jgi:hypothetical protein